MIFRRCIRQFCSTKNLLDKWYNQDDIKIQTFGRYSSTGNHNNTTLIGLPWEISMTEEWSLKMAKIYEQEFDSKNSNPVIVQSDCAPNIGLNRIYGAKLIADNVYKGIVDPVTSSNENNPDLPSSVFQLILVDRFLVDPENKHGTPEEFKDAFNLLSQDYPELSRRLANTYKMNDLMALFAGPAILRGRDLMIGGLSELLFRKIIATSVSLATLKTTFMDCIRQMNTLQQEDQEFAKNFLFQRFADLIVPYENQMLYLVLSKFKRPVTLICNSYNIPGLKQLKQKQTLEDAAQISKIAKFDKFFIIQRNPLTAEDNDQILIEKHAILESLLSNGLWQEPFIKNMFPYLSEDYKSLSQTQQNTIKDRYKYHLNRYTSARNKLFNS